jgi:anti-anti-sigma factor
MIVQYSAQQMDPDITVLNLAGQLSLGNRLSEIEYDVKNRIQQGARKLLVDLTQLTYIDSAGLGTIAVLAGSVGRAGGKLAIAGAAGKVLEVMEITNLNKVLCLCADVAAARAALSEAAGSAAPA